MHKSLNFLIDEYCEALARTRRLKAKAAKRGKEGETDVSILSGMENSLSWAIEYMVTGYMPQYSEGPYRRQVPTDPLTVLTRYSNAVVCQRVKDEKREAALMILNDLTEKEKEACMLVWVEGFSIRDAAKIMKLPKSTVWLCVQRARGKLRRE
jgi:DNA-directed RNA polymerase specialized sigma24 family protein